MSIDKSRTLLEEENFVSLRSAFVTDDGNLVSLQLMPALHSSIQGNEAPKFKEWVSGDFVWLYRHRRSDLDEAKLLRESCMEQGIFPRVFEKPPKFQLVWTDSGQGLAVYINGEPWAFIDESTRQGYSKGILDPQTCHPWDERLFKQLFLSDQTT